MLGVVIGYLLGSISPAYVLGWILKRADIRKLGDGNAGTTNVFHVLGLWPAVLTAVFDLAKGLLAILISYLLHEPAPLMYLAGLAAVIGHIYPFYLGFRGGQGMATAVGLLPYYFWAALKSQPFYDLKNIIYSAIVIAIFALSIFFVSKKGAVVGVFAVPAFIFLLLLNFKITAALLFFIAVLTIILVVQLYNVIRKRIIPVEKIKKQILHWRTLARPLAILFPIFSLILPKNIFLYITGAVAGIFILLDLIRLLSPRINFFLYKRVAPLLKEKDKRRFSSMTFFLSAVFIVFLAFPTNIAISATVFLVFGDLAAKFFGLLYGRRHFLTKTFQGSLSYFIFSLLIAFIFSFFAPIPFWILILGALTASITEAVSIFGIDDNFTVALISGSLMLAFMKLV